MFAKWYYECVPQKVDSPLRMRIECVLGKDCMDIHLSQERMQRVRNCIAAHGREVRIVHSTCCRGPDCDRPGKYCSEFISVMLWAVAAWGITHAGEDAETQLATVHHATGVAPGKIRKIIQAAMLADSYSANEIKHLIRRQVMLKH